MKEEMFYDIYIDGTICELDKCTIELTSKPIPLGPVGVYAKFRSGPVKWAIRAQSSRNLHPSIVYKNIVTVTIISKTSGSTYCGKAVVSPISYLEYLDDDKIANFVLTGEGPLKELDRSLMFCGKYED